MRIAIDITSKTLPVIMWSDYSRLTADKENWYYKFTMQNLWNTDVYIENWETATIDNGYKLLKWNEVEIVSKNINKLNLISDWAINDNIRIITN